MVTALYHLWSWLRLPLRTHTHSAITRLALFLRSNIGEQGNTFLVAMKRNYSVLTRCRLQYHGGRPASLRVRASSRRHDRTQEWFAASPCVVGCYADSATRQDPPLRPLAKSSLAGWLRRNQSIGQSHHERVFLKSSHAADRLSTSPRWSALHKRNFQEKCKCRRGPVERGEKALKPCRPFNATAAQ